MKLRKPKSMTLTKSNHNPNEIPVGYITKQAIDVCKGDVVEGIGIIRKIVFVGEQDFVSNGLGYKASAVELQTVSVLTGKKLYFVLPFEAPVKILQYASTDDYEFDWLPLESPNLIFSSKDDNFIESFNNLLGNMNND